MRERKNMADHTKYLLKQEDSARNVGIFVLNVRYVDVNVNAVFSKKNLKYKYPMQNTMTQANTNHLTMMLII